MYNLLSYQQGTIFTGQEINQWAKETFFEAKDPMKKHMAKWVLDHYTLNSKRRYAFYMGYKSDNREQRRTPLFLRV